tara:strand:- start:107 stop:496 length:390 start_codon:yes stop_codon:yes gene_type:complete
MGIKITDMKNQSNVKQDNNFAKLEDFIKKNPDFQESPFFQGWCDGDNYFSMTIGGKTKPMNRAIYNLIVSKRDVCLYAKLGMKPHRGWKIGDVKRYFGLKGNINTLLPKYLELCDIMLGGEDSGKNPLN